MTITGHLQKISADIDIFASSISKTGTIVLRESKFPSRFLLDIYALVECFLIRVISYSRSKTRTDPSPLEQRYWTMLHGSELL